MDTMCKQGRSSRRHHCASGGGYSVIELLAVLGIFAVFMASQLPHVDTRRQSLDAVVAEVVGDYRFARMRAITSGDHFSVAWDGQHAYEIRRHRRLGTDWPVAAVVRRVELPAYITASPLVPAALEFNTRGILVSATEPSSQTITDDAFGAARRIAIWPSGQIHAAE
jgi:hypothetical protein